MTDGQFPPWPCSTAEMIRHLERNGFHRVRSRRRIKLRNDRGQPITMPRHRQLSEDTYYRIRHLIGR
ncbi:hypothetical protein [Streptosporangium pseudovulgare]|nr:hypothetical protein [Streptosporangium pseudovulgare]